MECFVVTSNICNDMRIAIVIPVYKPQLTSKEYISLKQCYDVLNKYPIYIIAPKSLDLTIYNEWFHIRSIRFDDENFTSVEAYSKFCLEKELYSAFDQFDYILIYQLDAFVFSDRLLEWCEKGYDYIGAPCPNTFWGDVPFWVGNGGFSLRKVISFLRIVSQKDKLIVDIKNEFGDFLVKKLRTMEDFFFSYCGYRKDIDFCTPSVKEALSFSVEYNINGIYESIKTDLPFGCHRWDRYRFNTWWPIISGYGYELSKDEIAKEREEFPNFEYFLVMRMIRGGGQIEKIQSAFIDIVKNTEVAVWGIGETGVGILSALDTIGIAIRIKYDKKLSDNNNIFYPNKITIENEGSVIIITTTKYRKEISDEIAEWGFKKDKDYFIWDEIVNEIAIKLNIHTMGEAVYEKRNE